MNQPATSVRIRNKSKRLSLKFLWSSNIPQDLA